MSGNQSLTMGDRGRVVIPADVRERHHLEPGTRLILLETEDGILLVTRAQLLDRIRRKLAGGPSLVDELIRERREAAARGE